MPAGSDRVEQILVRVGESPADPGEHRVDGAGRHACLEELFGELDRVTARETVAHRQGRYRRLKPGSEMAPSNAPRELAGASGSAPGAAHALTAMLDDTDRDHRELFDLVSRRLAHRRLVAFAEHVAALAVRRPVIDELAPRPRRQQRTPVPLVSGLPARFASRTILPSPGRAPRRIRARRPR